MPSLSSFCGVDSPGRYSRSAMNALSLRLPAARIRDGVDDHDVGLRRVRDPHLGAVEYDRRRRRAQCGRAHAHDVRACPCLAHGQGTESARRTRALAEYRAFLLVAAPAAQLVDAQIGVRAVGQAESRRMPG